MEGRSVGGGCLGGEGRSVGGGAVEVGRVGVLGGGC